MFHFYLSTIRDGAWLDLHADPLVVAQFRKMDFNETTTTDLVAIHPSYKKALGVKIND